jgi:hypothetical protein
MIGSRDLRPRFGVCVLGVVLVAINESCSTVPPRSRRVDSVAAFYLPRVHLGEPAITVQQALPNVPDRAMIAETAPRTDAVDGYSLNAFEFSTTFAGSLRGLFGGSAGHILGSLTQIQLISRDSAAAARAIARVSATFGHPPEEGCASWPGIGSDRVLYWRAADRGGVAITLPVRTEGGDTRNRQWVSQLLLTAGRLRRRGIEIGFEDHLCPSIAAEPRDHPN